MKRNRSETDRPGACGIERKVTKVRRISSGHDVGGRRSGGVVGATTVTAATPRSSSSSSTHQPPASTTSQTHADHHQQRVSLRSTAHSTSTMMATLVKEALVSGSAEQLYEYIDKKFLTTMPSSEIWCEECEFMIAASLFNLIWEKSGTYQTRMKLLFQDFLERWHENGTIEDLVTDCTNSQKSSLFSCLIHLSDILKCTNLEVDILEECLKWEGREIPPTWLSDMSGVKYGGYSDINYLLHAVSLALKRHRLNFNYSSNYTGSLIGFLIAIQYYQRGHYNESLHTLNGLSLNNQGDDLSGWIQWLSGINLIHCGKYHSALLKLQSAIDSSNLCTRALFQVSQLFHFLDQKSAELETLSLLAVADHGGESNTHNLQSCVLEHLHPHNPEVNIVALFLLAARCLQQKMYKDASKRFNELLSKVQHPPIEKRPFQTLLRSQDDIPSMPETLCINILAGLAEYKSGNFKEAIDIGKIAPIENINFFETVTKKKVFCISAICGHLVRIKSHMNINYFKEALVACIE
ncbi:unnamed protein product [Meganyctiphanes norvegica]|uniref:Anaphase-promoting complex subunit 5 n=1 Tax=Meganyctiphanes norvegica TaxID=48144 RepID=A0AAV2R2I7_MEGNR